ncbi:MAG: hypothetical protein M3214_06910 [Actinomycetota bacterium]|nr:hypothetical protein [Actinomycetota bacterium]
MAEFIQADRGSQAARKRLPESVRRNPVIFPRQDALTNVTFTADLGEDEGLYEDSLGARTGSFVTDLTTLAGARRALHL